MPDREPTAAESLFLDELWKRVDGFDVWFGRGLAGDPRLTVSYPCIDGDRAGTAVPAYDGRRLRGGWRTASPAWADDAGMDDPLDAGSRNGLRVDNIEPTPAAASAADWLTRRTGRPTPAPPSPVVTGLATLVVLLVAVALLLVLVWLGPLLLYRYVFPDGPFA
ncbi:hypothetical protein DLJ46_27015 [Micromonospora globispora]|uniref:Uncharacterized protein n=1 Tax=Micromonospora globispora TaxID=1450148 RepID=A0A317JUE2_9ACTN|nr:hypothetical protein [Micromonospora globispora]PWU44245.1 hypothetical protein DLJ46_27015 [Micromonospora globispora]